MEMLSQLETEHPSLRQSRLCVLSIEVAVNMKSDDKTKKE